MRSLGAVLALLLTACASGVKDGETRVLVDVVWVRGASGREVSWPQGIERVGVPRLTLGFYAVDSSQDAHDLVQALSARGDSVIVGLGAAVWSALEEGGRKGVRLWLGYDPPPRMSDRILAWWASLDSLRSEVAGRAARRGPVTVVGSRLAPGVREVLGQWVLVAPVGHGLVPHARNPLLVLEDVALPEGAGENVYWLAETPCSAAPRGWIVMRMDWNEALVAALRWHFGTGGVPPGPSLGRWVGLEGTPEES